MIRRETSIGINVDIRQPKVPDYLAKYPVSGKKKLDYSASGKKKTELA